MHEQCLTASNVTPVKTVEEEEEGFYKFLPANTADRLCQLWQSCSNHHEI